MKKLMWGLFGVALAASVVAASAQEVLSANTIGYIKKELPAGGKLISLTVPLFSMTEGSNVFGRTSFAQEAPNGSGVYFWNTTNRDSKAVCSLLSCSQTVASGRQMLN